MSKDFFQRNVQAANDLRSEQFKTRQYLQRGKYRMKQKFFNKGKKHYDFDLNSQEYFHQELYDIIFQNSQVQEQFNNYVQKFLQQPCQFKNESKYHVQGISSGKNQSEAKHLLYRFFNNRIQDLQYEKYLIMQRLYNINAEEQISLVKSRLVLIDKEIQMAITRSDRLSCQDYFQQTYTLGGKPVPINQNGQSIYKYLDEEDCWYSNIHRDDIIIYSRNKIYRRDLLHRTFYPLYYQHKHLVKTEGLSMLLEVEQEIAKNYSKIKQIALKKSNKIINIFEKQLQLISPGNLVEKQNINSFIYYNFGAQEDQPPLNLPLYPAMYSELLDNYNAVMPYFFKSLEIKQHKQLITLLPKFNNFCAIIFKYQNKEILEGKQEIKLGLQDDIDIKKELFTMLQEIWVNKYVKIDFSRFDIRFRLHSVDWPLDIISQEHSRQKKHHQGYRESMKENTEIKTLLNILKGNNYTNFRKHMKRHSQIIVNRLKDKFTHMQRINRYNVLNNQQHTLQQLGQFFRIKFNEKETHTESILKQNASLFFSIILKKHLVINPVQIQIQQTLRVIKLRESRLKLMNILNGMRCYHRNLAFDLRVISNFKFQFQLDDEMLINSNKQVLQSFEKAVKDTQTFFSKGSNESNPLKLTQEEFIQHQNYGRQKLYKQDKVTYSYYGEQIAQVLVSNGKRLKNKILYQIVLEDIEEIEERILRNSTNYINRYERYIKIKSLDQIVDRVELLSRIYELQLEYQFQKLRLIQAYYFIYQNTKEPLQAFKLSKIIVNLIYRQAVLDLEEKSFQHAYRLNIEAIKQQVKLINQINLQFEKTEDQRCKTFHDKFARSLNIPLTLLAYLYGDLERKGPKNISKIQRMNSMVSKISKDSKGKQEKPNKFEFQIKQQFPQVDQSEQQFDLQNYDQYLLRKNMDAIFDDMVGDQNGNPKEAIPVNTVAIQNLIVNPRFQGGPHVKVNIFPQISSTSQKKVNLLNFMEVSWAIGNIRYIIDQLQQQFEKQYGFCSTLYQLAFMQTLLKKMNFCFFNPSELPPKWMTFETDDPYFQAVTKGMRYYEQVMASCLEPPSNVQLSIPSTFERHHQKITSYGSLQYFDYHSIHSLIMLKKPVNSFRYRQHNLGVGFIDLLQFQDSVWMMQLERRELQKSYQNLGKHCQMVMERYVSEYTNTGQSEIFLAVQQNKLYNTDITKYLVYPDMLEEVREYVACQLADIQVFKKHIQFSKKQLEDLLIMKYQLDKSFLNNRLDKSRILAPKDPKDIKKLKNRILGIISILGGQVLKGNTFLKYKMLLKTTLQNKLKQIAQNDYDKVVENKQKMANHCLGILVAKYKRLMQIKLLQSYSKDLLMTANKLNVGIQTIKHIQKLKNYTISVPFLSKIFTVPTQNRLIDNKLLYDQAKDKKIIPIQQQSFADGQVKDIYYIFSIQQYLQEWFKENNVPAFNNMAMLDTKAIITGLSPPLAKQQIFKWAFKIPQTNNDVTQRDSLNYFIKLMHPFSGKVTQPSYKQQGFYMQEPPRNKFLNLMKHYKSMVQYIEANILVISLQIQEEVLYSLQNIIKKKINFQQRYFITDENSIRQTINTLQNQDLSVVFNFAIDFAKLNKHVAQKIIDRNYVDKKQHWVVHDQIIDFMMSKIQGYGLIRKSYLPLCDDLKLLKDIKGSPTNYLVNKTNNIYKLIYLSSMETYLNQINQENSDFHIYQHQINEWLCHTQRLQDYGSSGDKNSRANLSNFLSQNEDEKQRFMNGLYVNDSNMLVHRLKHVGPIPSHDIKAFTQKLLFKNDFQEEKVYSYIHNQRFIDEAMSLFKLIGQKNRFKVFARIRHHFDLADNYLSTKPSNLAVNESEIYKSGYLDLLIGKKVFTLSCIAFSAKVILPANAKTFKQTYMELKQINQIYSHNLFQNLEKFKDQNKIQFSKAELNLIGRNEGGNDHQHNNIIKEVISFKLLKEEFRFRVLSQSLRLLKSQRIPKTEPKRIINASLIPRVHLISSYSSPLMVDRKTYISQQYKLSFLQAFINRFRNKVSRVDLLSSGYGFVITVPDLQDCVNYMNKLLFTFTEKEFKHRIQTFSQYYQILIEAINEKNKTINQQSALIKYLQNKNNNLLQAQYLSKVTKLLHEKTILEDKLLIMQNNINGLQDRVRKTVQIQYDKKLAKLQKQNEQLRQIFTKVKHLHMINTKEAAKNDYLDIINCYKDKINDLLNKKIDFTISFDSQAPKKYSNNNEKVTDSDNSNKYKFRQEKSSDDKYYTQDLQKCQLGQDILFDPYYATKLINKMRLFNLFKLGSKKLKFQQQQFQNQQKIGELHKIQDIVVAQSERQILVRTELSKVQQELSKKCLEMEKLKQSFDTMQNQKTKLKILMQSKQKKIQQRDRQLQQLKKSIQEKDKLLAQRELIQKEKNSEKIIQEIPKLNALRKEKKYKKMQKTFMTNAELQSNHQTLSLYEKFQLSNKDSTWREKCEQLYIENKRLQRQLQQYQNNPTNIPSTPKRQGLSLNLRLRKESLSQASQKPQGRFPNISFKYNILKQ